MFKLVKNAVSILVLVLATVQVEAFYNGMATTDEGGPGKPPILQHIRVSREESEGKGGPTPTTSSALMKTPPYQLKQTHMYKLLHSNPHSSSTSNMLFRFNPDPSQMYPVPGTLTHTGSRDNVRRMRMAMLTPEDWITQDEDDEREGRQDKTRTFNPYISSRVLSNLPRFFEHLQDNIKAIHNSNEIPDSSSSISVENEGYLDSGEDRMDKPERRGDYNLYDGRLSVEEGGPGGVGYIYDPSNLEDDKTGEYAARNLLAYMGRDPKYKKANRHDPAWLFTNLGLGKRSGSRDGGRIGHTYDRNRKWQWAF